MEVFERMNGDIVFWSETEILLPYQSKPKFKTRRTKDSDRESNNR